MSLKTSIFSIFLAIGLIISSSYKVEAHEHHNSGTSDKMIANHCKYDHSKKGLKECEKHHHRMLDKAYNKKIYPTSHGVYNDIDLHCRCDHKSKGSKALKRCEAIHLKAWKHQGRIISRYGHDHKMCPAAVTAKAKKDAMQRDRNSRDDRKNNSNGKLKYGVY